MTIKGSAATVVTGSRSSSGLKVYDPGLGAGANYDVAVTQSTCAVAHGTITYQNPTPSVTGVTSQAGGCGNYGSTAGGQPITINGANFVSASQLTANMYGNGWSPGTWSFTVSNPPAGTYPSGYTMVPPPTMSSIGPSPYIGINSSQSFTINGANFPLSTNYCKVWFNGTAYNCTSASASQVATASITMPSTAGDYTLTLYGRRTTAPTILGMPSGAATTA